jgi:6,7-dimethyl-8-ribityllumazine synthase
MSFGIVVSEYNEEVTFALRDGCIHTLLEHGAQERNIRIHHVPGAFELTGAAAIIANKLEPDAIITLGCVIKGETEHDRYINEAVARELAHLNSVYNLPVIFGLLTVNDLAQAHDRAGGRHGNKGVECAVSAIKMVNLYRQVRAASMNY